MHVDGKRHCAARDRFELARPIILKALLEGVESVGAGGPPGRRIAGRITPNQSKSCGDGGVKKCDTAPSAVHSGLQA